MKASNINKSGMFRIRAFNRKHTCPLKDRVYSQQHVTSNLIGGIVKPKLVDHKRKYTPSDIKKMLRLILELMLTICWLERPKRKLWNLWGVHPAGLYANLPAYLYMMDNTYLRSHIRMKRLLIMSSCIYLLHWIHLYGDLCTVDQ